ncbi:N-acetylmuramidase family protein [Terricaulis sp.]|uniref:N-acetylmuramidase family protein n=1 Tax=Terricaulis sp. TaxID=2768686 RepID=UPI00378444C0
MIVLRAIGLALALACAGCASSPPLSPGYLGTLYAEDRRSLDDEDIAALAQRIDVQPEALAAAIDVMSTRQGGFQANGRATILFEPHIFSRRTEHRFDQSHPSVSYLTWNAQSYPRTQEARWAQLREAFALDPENALAAASWGRFQIMGLNYQTVGFSSPSELVTFMTRSEANQAEVFVRFIVANHLDDNLRNLDWEGFARVYNGPGQVERYAEQLRTAYARRTQR